MDIIYLSPPDYSEDERHFVYQALKSNWIAPTGPCLTEFENRMTDYIKIKSACALSSGTSALHLALIILGIKKNDIVLCPSFTFTASANVILYQGATPVFIDSDPKYWTIDTEALEKAIIQYKPKALISVDIYGQSCDYDRVVFLCKKYNIFLIEDSAEALGSKYKNINCGNFGDISILSFNGNKIMTTGGGGMLLSNNTNYVKRAKFLSSQAKEKQVHYEHKELGYNYRLSNILAAIGCGQIERLDSFILKRRAIFNRYYNAFSKLESVTFMEDLEHSVSNRWLTTLLLDPSKTNVTKSQIIGCLKNEKIESRPLWKPMHMQPLYKDCKFIKNDKKDVSRELFETGLCLPSGSNLSKSNQNRIIDIMLSLF